MNDPKLDYKNEFPVELVNPDISPYKNSNTGIDYVITLDRFKWSTRFNIINCTW